MKIKHEHYAFFLLCSFTISIGILEQITFIVEQGSSIIFHQQDVYLLIFEILLFTKRRRPLTNCKRIRQNPYHENQT